MQNVFQFLLSLKPFLHLDPEQKNNLVKQKVVEYSIQFKRMQNVLKIADGHSTSKINPVIECRVVKMC